MNQEHKIVLYQVEDTNIYVNVMFKEDTFWMTQKAMADLFECTTDNISLHLKNIYKEEELDENRTTEFFSVVQNEGQRNVKRKVKCYNLDAIIAVGYRVNSKKATRFRQWATKTLKEYIAKGFVLNDDMLKIRASERRAYQKITDVFEQCSYDYDKNSEITKAFYAFVQNKLHFAVTGKTAAELIYERADSEKPAMGLTTWKDSPDGKILKRDIGIAKNYLNEKELSRLNRLVTMFIDYAELMAEDEILMSMQDWVDQTNQFLLNNRRKVLNGKGKISHDVAMQKAEKEYEVFRVKQDREYVSEFDREVEKYLKGND